MPENVSVRNGAITMRATCQWGLSILLSCGALLAGDFPKAEISNRVIRAELMLPDARRGSYRGTRFDWSGIISSLQYAGHEYFGQWYEKHDPLIHDAITGPVEEFLTDEAGLGYKEAAPGESFVRIGIGAVNKPNEKAYRRFETYDIADPGVWTIRKGRDWIEFTHKLATRNGYAYIYRKKLRLARDKPELIIEHSLKNTGRKIIDSLQYNHNFFVIDRETVGPDVAIRFSFPPRARRPLSNGVEIKGEQIAFSHELQKGESFFSELDGFGAEAKDYDFRIENLKTGAGVHVTCDRPLERMYFWCMRTVASAEPYVKLDVEPHREARWTLKYDFYTMAQSSAK